jgi:hypothetical protein
LDALRNASADFTIRTARSAGGRPAPGVINLVGRQQLGGWRCRSSCYLRRYSIQNRANLGLVSLRSSVAPTGRRLVSPRGPQTRRPRLIARPRHHHHRREHGTRSHRVAHGTPRPHGLAIGDNVRDNAALSPEFLDSIQQHGVPVPITAAHGQDGTVTVRNGQRFILAARKAGLTSIAAYVLPRQRRRPGHRGGRTHRAPDHHQRSQGRLHLRPARPRHPADARRRRLGHEVAKLSVSRESVKTAAAAAGSAAAMAALSAPRTGRCWVSPGSGARPDRRTADPRGPSISRGQHRRAPT